MALTKAPEELLDKEYRELRAKTIRDYCKGDAPIIADVKSLYKKEDLINEGFNVLRL